MVCLPLFTDQPRNAARIQDLKAGVRGVLDTRAYCDTAESFARKMAELPVFTDIPDHLVSAV
jgi:UDP:flavonoid glycosyltransferase YjiC (YdhE family)